MSWTRAFSRETLVTMVGRFNDCSYERCNDERAFGKPRPELLWRKLSIKCVRVYTGHTAPTNRQPIMSIRSYMPLYGALHIVTKVGRRSDVVRRLIWPPQANRGSASASHQTYGASGPHYQIKHTWVSLWAGYVKGTWDVGIKKHMNSYLFWAS